MLRRDDFSICYCFLCFKYVYYHRFGTYYTSNWLYFWFRNMQLLVKCRLMSFFNSRSYVNSDNAGHNQTPKKYLHLWKSNTSSIGQYLAPISLYLTSVSQYHTSVSQYLKPISQYIAPISHYHTSIGQYHPLLAATFYILPTCNKIMLSKYNTNTDGRILGKVITTEFICCVRHNPNVYWNFFISNSKFNYTLLK